LGVIDLENFLAFTSSAPRLEGETDLAPRKESLLLVEEAEDPRRGAGDLEARRFPLEPLPPPAGGVLPRRWSV